MNFSEPITVSIGTLSISPSSKYVASAIHCQLTVRSSATLSVFQSRKCMDLIHSLSWSPDSLFILCVLKKRGVVQIFSVDNPEWACKVDEGSAGLLSAVWSPDSRHILTIADFYLRITIWSLSETSVSYLKHAKACANNLIFSPDGRYLALLERREFRDHLSLFDCTNNWKPLHSLQLDTQDATGLLWSPDGCYLAIWDECLCYRVVVCSVDGRLLHTYCAYEQGQDLLGLKSVCWSPTGQLLALGSYDQKCRILNSINWVCLATLVHPVDRPICPHLGLSPTGKPIPANNHQLMGNTDCLGYRPHRVDVYEEWCPAKSDSSVSGQHSDRKSGVVYRLIKDSVTVRSVHPNPKLPFPKIGIGLMAFSTDGRFLATRNDNAQHAIWIWSIDYRLSLFSLLLHSRGVTSLVWDPTSPARLALCTGTDSIFMWTPQGCLAVQAPQHFNLQVHSLTWLSSGDTLLLKSDSQFSLCYLESENDNHADRVHPIVWRPPHSSIVQSSVKPLIDSPLPTGNFGPGDRTHDSTTDTPKWLGHHDRRQTEKSGVVEPRRSTSYRTVDRRSSRSAISDRPASLISTTRQLWIPPNTIANPETSSFAPSHRT